MFAEAQRRHAAHEVQRAIPLAERALALDPDYVEALEYLATALITRRKQYAEGLALIDRALALRADDPGLWYAAGWCYEFVAHEIARRHPSGVDFDSQELYQLAADAFRRCLASNPEGKLAGDAQDLLDHVENELSSR